MRSTGVKKYSILCILLIVLASLVACSFDINTNSSTSGSDLSIGKISYYIPSSNGGWTFLSSKTTKGEALLVFPKEPAIKGKVFYGWYDSEDFSNEIIESSYLTTTITSEIKLYAKYIDEKDAVDPTITFVTNGGTTIAPTTVNFKSKLPSVVTTRKDGSFVGWYFDEEFQNPVDIEYYTFRENITLYARWRIDGNNLYWELNGGASTAYLQDTYSSSYKISLPDSSKITKLGYELDGWYIDSALTTRFSGNSSDYSGELTLYAKWKGKEYNISYHVDTNIFDFVAQDYPTTFVYGTSLELFDPTPKDKKYIFAGWYLDSDLENALDKNNLPASDIDLYPKRELYGDAVTWELNGGACSSALQDIYSSQYPIIVPQASSLTRLGYTFAGWYTNASLTAAYSGNSSDYSGAITLYAKWTGNIYTITYHVDEELYDFDSMSNPSSFEYGKSIEITNPIAKDVKYAFAGWYLDSSLQTPLNKNNPPAKNIDLYPKRELYGNAVTWELNGGTCSQELQDIYSSQYPIVLPQESSLTRLGYTFAGWYTNAALTAAYSGNSSDYSGAITLYAKWSGNEYTITYHVDTDIFDFNESNYPSTFIYGDQLVLSDLTTKDSLNTFAGWYLDSAYSTKLVLENIPASNIDVYARYVEGNILNEFDEVPNQETIIYSSSITKSLGVTLDSNIEVYASSIDAQNYIAYNKNSLSLLIFNKDYLSSISVGKREKVTFNVRNTTDDTVSEISYYLVPVMTTPYNFDKMLSYEKSTASSLTITSSLTISSSSIYCVFIDNAKFDYTYSSNSIIISSSDMSKLTIGRHIYEIYTDLGVSSGIIDITCVSKKAPYNVEIDIDSSYPTIYITWDCDFTPDYYKVTIGSNSYTSTSYPSKFNGNVFNATNLITTKGTIVTVSAIKDTVAYESLSDTMPLTIADGAEEVLSKEYGYTFAGQTSNWYFTTFDEIYDAMFYTRTYWLDFEKKTTIDSNVFSYFHYCINEEVLNDSRIDFSDSNLNYYAKSNTLVAFTEEEKVITNAAYAFGVLKYVMSKLPEADSYSAGYLAPTNTTFATSNDNDYYFYFRSRTGLNKAPNETDEQAIRNQSEVSGYSQIEKQNTHFGSGLPEDYVFPIEQNNKGDAVVNSSVELYVALEKGYNPIINSENASLTNLYNIMKQSLRSILDTTMNEFEIAIAIYEYLDLIILYDHTLVADKTVNPTDDPYYYFYTTYYLEGVFIYGVAVCNAIAPAYASLLNMMGINAHKLVGDTTSGGHAWVELQIGGLWYIADPTWGNRAFKISENNIYEMIDYSYLFIPYTTSYNQGRTLTEPEVYGEHYSGDESVDIFKMLTFTYNSVEYDYYIESLNEVSVARTYMVNKFGSSMTSGEYMAIELKFASTTYYTSFIATLSGYTIYSGSTGNNTYCFLIKKN